MRFRRFLAIFLARNHEFLRDRAAMSWNIVLPVLIVMVFAFAFSTDNRNLFKVAVTGTESGNTQITRFLETEHIQFLRVEQIEAAVRKVSRHQIDMLIDLSQLRYWINDTSANGYIVERLLTSTVSGLQKVAVTGAEIRYVDWLIPGVLGMNIMFSSLFGVGYAIVRYRKNGVLKRLKATPLSAFEFLSAHIASRLLLIALLTSLVYLGTDLVVDFRMYGSYLNLLLVLLLGTLSMISLGLVVAARMANEEAANGLLNLMSWPMMLLSGVWFSLEGSPELVRQFGQLLPLTHVIDAARSIMIDGAGLTDIGDNLLILLSMSILFLLIGARSFRWE
jgi:ABC-2 type transport system permease protein